MEAIKKIAFELGFDHVSLTAPAITSDRQRAFNEWRDAGWAAGMNYMVRQPEKRMDPRQIFPEVKSILTLGVSYYQGPVPESPGPGYGRVARYAWGIDYHEVILERLKIFLQELRSILGPDFKSEIAVDTKPILERALAESAGLGFIGKNTLMILPRSERHRLGFHVGSFVFLAEIFFDLPLAEGDADPEKMEGCGSCQKCLVACPTNAFVGPYQLNSGRCISYLTIENKDGIDRSLRSRMGNWVFGCDVCQDVCPFNGRAFETRWPEFGADRGVGSWISLRDILLLENDAAFKARYGKTPLARAKRRGLIRNACVAAGNSGDTTLTDPLKMRLQDPDGLIRSHALWALGRLLPRPESKNMAQQLLKVDRDPQVQEEGRVLLENEI